MHGSSTSNQPGIYGTKGVPSDTTVPSNRFRAISWSDSEYNLWLFGGALYTTDNSYRM